MPSPISSPGGPPARGLDAQDQLRLVEGPTGLRRTVAVRGHAHPGVAPQERRRPAGLLGLTRQQGVDLPPLHHLGERAGHLCGQRGHDAPRPAAVRVNADGRVALAQVAAQAGRAAGHLVGFDLRATQQLLDERAAQGLLGLVPGLGHGDLGERGDRRHVQVIAGVGATGAEQQHRAQVAAPRGDRHLHRHLGRALRPPAGQTGGDVALQRPPFAPGSQPGHDHGHRGAGVGGGDLRHALEPVPGQHGAHHLEVGAARGGRASCLAGSARSPTA